MCDVNDVCVCVRVRLCKETGGRVVACCSVAKSTQFRPSQQGKLV